MDTCIYTRERGSKIIVSGIHVDDQVITGPNKKVVTKPFIHIMEVEVKRGRRRIILTLSQGAYMKRVINRYGTWDCNPTRVLFTPKLNFTQDDVLTTTPDPEVITYHRVKLDY